MNVAIVLKLVLLLLLGDALATMYVKGRTLMTVSKVTALLAERISHQLYTRAQGDRTHLATPK